MILQRCVFTRVNITHKDRNGKMAASTSVSVLMPQVDTSSVQTGKLLVGYLRLFIVATGFPSEQCPQKMISC